MVVQAEHGETIFLGKQGEHRAVVVSFDISRWAEEYGPGIASLIHMRETDFAPYPCLISQNGNEVRWEICNTDNAIPGMGRCELRYIQENRLVKSETWATKVIGSYGIGPTPEPFQAWVDSVLAVGVRVESAVIHGPKIQNGTWWVWDFTANSYIDTGVKASGESAGTWDSLTGKPFSRIDGVTLVSENSVLKVSTTDDAQEDNTKPITSSGVYVLVGNINTLLSLI